MRPFDRAWQLLKSYSAGAEQTIGHQRLARQPSMTSVPISEEIYGQQGALVPRPKTFENRQFNVMNIEDEDTRGRVRDTYNELEPANFSTGDDMAQRRTASERAARESDSDDFDYRPVIDGMRVNENPNYPALSRDDMDSRLKYPFPKDANNPGDFAGGY